MYVCMYVCVCIYRSKVLASEGQTTVISVIFVFCLFRRPRRIFFWQRRLDPSLKIFGVLPLHATESPHMYLMFG